MANNIQLLGTCRIYDALKIANDNSEINLLPRFWGFSHSTPEIIQNISLALKGDIDTEEQDIECLNFADFRHPRFRESAEIEASLTSANIIFVEFSSLKTYFFKGKYTQVNRISEYFGISVNEVDTALENNIQPGISQDKKQDWDSLVFHRQSLDELRSDISRIINLLAGYKVVLVNHFTVDDENKHRFEIRQSIRDCLVEAIDAQPSDVLHYDPTVKLREYGNPIIDYAHYEPSFIHLLSLEFRNVIGRIANVHPGEATNVKAAKEIGTAEDRPFDEKNYHDNSPRESIPALIVEKAISQLIDESISHKNNTVLFSVPEQPSSEYDTDLYTVDPMCAHHSPDFTKSYPVPPVHSYIIENGFLQGKTFFCCSIDHPDSSPTRLYMANQSHLRDYSKNTNLLDVEKDTVYIVSGNMGCKVFYHWFYQCLPAMLHARKILKERNCKYKFVVPELNGWQENSISIAGIPKEDCIVLTDNESISGARLFYTSLSSGKYSFAPTSLIFENMQSYRDRCLENRDVGKFGKNFYITRKDTPKRKILNEDELCEELEKLDFEIVTLSDHSLEDQAELFYFADCIIAPHGSGLVNLMFCDKNTHLIELIPENYFNSCFFRITQHIGMTYEQSISRTANLNGRHTSTSMADIESIIEMARLRTSSNESEELAKRTA